MTCPYPHTTSNHVRTAYLHASSEALRLDQLDGPSSGSCAPSAPASTSASASLCAQGFFEGPLGLPPLPTPSAVAQPVTFITPPISSTQAYAAEVVANSLPQPAAPSAPSAAAAPTRSSSFWLNLLRPNLLLLYALATWYAVVVSYMLLALGGSSVGVGPGHSNHARAHWSVFVSAASAAAIVGTALNANAWNSHHESLRAYIRRAPCAAARFYCVSFTTLALALLDQAGTNSSFAGSSSSSDSLTRSNGRLCSLDPLLRIVLLWSDRAPPAPLRVTVPALPAAAPRALVRPGCPNDAALRCVAVGHPTAAPRS